MPNYWVNYAQGIQVSVETVYPLNVHDPQIMGIKTVGKGGVWWKDQINFPIQLLWKNTSFVARVEV